MQSAADVGTGADLPRPPVFIGEQLDIRWTIKANQSYFKSLPRLFLGWLGMTELEAIDRDIRGLKELIRVAWMQLADPSLAPLERREARSRITACSKELRGHLKEAELGIARKRQLLKESSDRVRPKPQLRLLPDGY
jgi:hypothetical protein